MPTKRPAQPENPQPDPPEVHSTPELAEEIERIQALLRRLDGILAQKDEVTLKDLAQAVSTAGAGGRSIAQLRKFEKELERAVNDEDYERARASMFAMIDKLRRRWKTKLPAEKTKPETPDDRTHPPEPELVE